MAMKKITKNELFEELDSLYLEVNNGDLNAINEAIDKWNFKDEVSVLRFSLAVIAKAKNKKIYIEEDGEKIPLTPGEGLLKVEEVNPDEELK
jgi:arginyl-tRNA synthetase